MISRTVKVGSSVGLHARPAARLAQAVEETGVEFIIRKGDDTADASSVLEIMTLGAKNGDEVIIETEDDGAAAQLDKIAALIESDLDKE